MKKEKRLREDVVHRQVKYLNNGIESEHAQMKKLVLVTGSLKVRKRSGSTSEV
ncbi:DDE-type integrase/transposase/recombinase [Vibrio mediterranei]|uniref:DDE-type integrase/transposase/recombinase n=1 Tax=Vibrio mediterranei TaxID=689 RepID=UPI0023D855BD|nr:DDE-type integrase/transposase/recombinase [Vibrio mediterranei]